MIDINSQYIDCNINYYILDHVVELNDPKYDVSEESNGLSTVCLNPYRFVFPRIVQLSLPAGLRKGSWHPLKFTFFNGDAIYDSFWDIEETAAHDFILKAFDIKKEYIDCFTSDEPEMLVETQMAAICANKFPGNRRTLWTLYNRKFNTVRGEVISVPHIADATYYDVWNKRTIIPRESNGFAYIYLEMEPQSIGCIIQRC
jgi:hypothetical protein